MDIILLEAVNRIGNIGDRVRVRPGFARNYLFPRQMALPANEDNLRWVEQQRSELEKKQLERKSEAEQLAARVSETGLEIEAICGPEGQLHGSVTANDIIAAAGLQELVLSKSMITMPEQRIAAIGEYQVDIQTAPGIKAVLNLSVTAKASGA